jgi:hypothetical protein
VSAIRHPDLELGRAFALSLSSKDFPAIERLLHPNITFRALTPGKARYLWESHKPDLVVSEILKNWFEETDHIESLLKLDLDRVGDQNRVAYKFSVTNSDGKFEIEQQAYFSVTEGKISWMSLVCSGFRPV